MPAIAAPLDPPATVGGPACISSPQALLGRPGRLPGNGLGCLERLGHTAAAGSPARFFLTIDPKHVADRDAEFLGDFRDRDSGRALPGYDLLAGHAASLERVAGTEGGGSAPAGSACREEVAGELPIAWKSGP